jgi:hypothetical protein
MKDNLRSADEYTLLCERCGYVIEGLPAGGACPECGRPIALSLPERRTGTPWQKRRSVRTLVQTWWGTLRHPLLTFDTLRLDEIRFFGMIVPTLLLCSGGCLFIVCLLEIPRTEQIYMLPIGLFFLTVISLIPAAALLMISGAVSIGLQVLSRALKARITPDTAWHIVGVASVGWVLTYAVWLTAWSALRIYRMIHPLTGHEHRQRTMFELEYIEIPALLGGSAAGFAVLLGWALLGFHRLRYANRARPEPPRTDPHAASD